jgi:hypothetical protein
MIGAIIANSKKPYIAIILGTPSHNHLEFLSANILDAYNDPYDKIMIIWARESNLKFP